MTKRICVVGAGASGLPSIKACLEEGLDVVCYEKTSNIAGLWYYRSEPPEGVGSVQKKTITNTSKEINCYSDFPFPKEFPNYMHNKKLYQYLELYAKQFTLLAHILFEHSVLKIEKNNDYENTHRLKVTVCRNVDNSVFTEIFDGVMVCTGLHTTPNRPNFPGQQLFKGKIIHSQNMPSPSQLAIYEDKTAVVVGLANSGCDSAVELSNFCEKTYISSRRGAWIMYRMSSSGMPFDLKFHKRFIHYLMSCLPFSLICWFFHTFVYNQRFNHKLYGIKPDFRCLSNTLVLSDELPLRILTGQVIVKNNIERFTEDGVIFEGEVKETKCDLVVMATGYYFNFPIIDKSLLNHSKDKPIELYKQVFPKQLSHYSLAIIGALQPNGGIFSIFEIQSRWYAMLMTDKCQYPSHDQIVAEVEETKRRQQQIFIDSPGIYLNVDWISYCDDMADMIGVKPDIPKYILSDTKLFTKLVFGTCLPYQYRLSGNHCWTGARDAILQSDYRVRYALNPNEAKFGNCFDLTPNFYTFVFSLILFLFAFIAIEFFD